MATDAERQRRHDKEEAEYQALRRKIAREAGEPDWAFLPRFRDVARARGLKLFFPGTQCEAGHLVPRSVRTGKCIACANMTASDLRPSPRKSETIAQKFNRLAEKMEWTGHVHFFDRGWRMRASMKPISGDIRKACAKAAKRVEQTGKMHCVVPGSRGPVVRKYRG